MVLLLLYNPFWLIWSCREKYVSVLMYWGDFGRLKRFRYVQGVLLGILCGGVPPGSPRRIQTLFQTKKCHFPHPFSDLEVVTKRNIRVYINVIFAEIRTPAKRCLSFLFIYNWNDEHSLTLPSSLVNHTHPPPPWVANPVRRSKGMHGIAVCSLKNSRIRFVLYRIFLEQAFITNIPVIKFEELNFRLVLDE